MKIIGLAFMLAASLLPGTALAQAYPSKTVPTGNLLLSILDLYDIHQDSQGDSTGRLENL